MFWTRKRLDYLVKVLAVVTALGLAAVWYWWPAVEVWVKNYEPQLKLLGYIVAPAFAVVGFLATRADKFELVEKADKAARSEADAIRSHQELIQKQAELDDAKRNVDKREFQIRRLEENIRRLTDRSEDLWKVKKPKPFSQYREWHADERGAKIITIGNLKGGVGKTTVAANLAAYISEARHLPVLLIDLDYQGSLSNMMMLAAEKSDVESRVETLFDPAASPVQVSEAQVHLAPKLKQVWLSPANYTFAKLENVLLAKWLVEEQQEYDARYLLSRFLLRPEIRRDYAAIILDMPPRLTLGSLNALVASHYFIVPTVLDKLSAEAVATFLNQMKDISKDLQLPLKLAGIIGTLSRSNTLSATEQKAFELAREAGHVWDDKIDFMFKTVVPRRAAIGRSAGEDIAYMAGDNSDRAEARAVFDKLFADILTRIGL